MCKQGKKNKKAIMKEQKTRSRYEVDPHNRLIIRGAEAPGFRTVEDGRFKLDENHRLMYQVRRSQGKEDPQQIRLEGSWRLDKNRNLVYTLSKWGNQVYGNKLTIRGRLTRADAGSISAEIATREGEAERVYYLKFKGDWRVDEKNRLAFEIRSKTGKTDELTFKGSWEIDRKNQITCTYSKYDLLTKTRRQHQLRLKGYWNLTDTHRISYQVTNRQRYFDIDVGIGRPGRNSLSYRIGLRRSGRSRTITLYGKWRVTEKLGLTFEMPYQDGEVKRIVFGVSYQFDDDWNLAFRAAAGRNGRHNIEAKLSRRLLTGKGKFFIKGVLSDEQRAVMAGIGLKF